MLITQFEEQVKKNPGNLAIKDEKESFTYEELDRYAGRVGRAIKKTCRAHDAGGAVGLLFEHGPHMIAAILGALKAGKAYVPISVDYPEKRISYILSHSEATLIVTNTRHEEMAGKLARENNIPVLDIDSDNDDSVAAENERTGAAGDAIAYIMYTSGSTGRPKGVTQTHKNVLYYIGNWARLFAVAASDRMTLLSSFCHDASVMDIYGALLNGAALYPYDLKNREESGKLSEFLIKEKITIWHSVPSLFSYFCTTLSGEEKFPDLRFILLGGEPIRRHEITTAGKFFPHSLLVNVYGQTESSIDSVWMIHRENDQIKSNTRLRIGAPLDETQILVVDAAGNEVDILEQGEIIVCSNYLSPGYWRDPETTRKTFSEDEELGRLYWTGDLGRLLPGGDIEFLGRKDFQVKIRGYRIELGEIENLLLKHERIKEAVVTARESDDGEKYLAAYYTPSAKNQNPLKVPELRKYLADELPDYMIPTFFIQLEQFPLTQSRKIDRKALPQPVNLGTEASEYVPPQTQVEEKIAEIWAGLLGLEKTRISSDANFFQLGGHSLKATTLVLKIHKAFDAKVSLPEFFSNPTIRGLAEYIKTRSKTGEGYTRIDAVEKKEYHALSPAQRRLYILQQMDPASIVYNMISPIELKGELREEKLAQTFKNLIRRHESLRTSFTTVNEEPVQRIHDDAEFEIERLGARDQELGVQSFIRPFDLSRWPLLRVGLVEMEKDAHILIVDLHHIISDAISQQVLVQDFVRVYTGQEPAPLKLQYKDYCQWLQRQEVKETYNRQEAYWLKRFEGKLPVLELPHDYPRSPVQNFEGRGLGFQVEKDRAEALRKYALEEGVTLQILMKAVFHILLFKLGGQEDIITGTTIAGRGHADLEKIIGLFVNTLPIRTFPADEKTFRDYLKEVKEISLAAYENQDYPFDSLVKKAVGAQRDTGRNPIFDIMFEIRITETGTDDAAKLEIPGLQLRPYPMEINTTKFDQDWLGRETINGMTFSITYAAKLFEQETIQLMIDMYLRLIENITAAPQSKIKDLDCRPVYEKELTGAREVAFNF